MIDQLKEIYTDAMLELIGMTQWCPREAEPANRVGYLAPICTIKGE
jgi:hypothetical protein